MTDQEKALLTLARLSGGEGCFIAIETDIVSDSSISINLYFGRNREAPYVTLYTQGIGDWVEGGRSLYGEARLHFPNAQFIIKEKG